MSGAGASEVTDIARHRIHACLQNLHRTRTFARHCSVLLHCTVKIPDGAVHFVQATALLCRSGSNVQDTVANFRDSGIDGMQRLTGLTDQIDTAAHLSF